MATLNGLFPARRLWHPYNGTVIFLHGYGANGSDLIGLADPLAPHLPDTRFLAAEQMSPERCPGQSAGLPVLSDPELAQSRTPKASSARLGGPVTTACSTPGSTKSRRKERRKSRLCSLASVRAPMMALHVENAPGGAVDGDRAFSRKASRSAAARDGNHRAPACPARAPATRIRSSPFTRFSRGGNGPRRCRSQGECQNPEPGFTHYGPRGLGLALGFVRDQLGLFAVVILRFMRLESKLH